MRDLFLVAAKLLGLMQFVRAVASFLPVLFSICGLARMGISSGHDWILFSSMAWLTVEVFFAWVLVFRTDWIAGVLRIPSSPRSSGIDRHVALTVGLKLIGVYFTVYAAPKVVDLLWTCTMDWYNNPPCKLKDVAPIVQLGLGLLLICATGKIIRLIAGRECTAATQAP